MTTHDIACDREQKVQSEERILRLDDQLEALPSLTQKFVIDFANGIDVVNDHIDTQQTRGGFFVRMYESFNGTAHRRQNAINASLARGVEASLTWLTELTEQLANSNLAISRVNERVIQIRQDLNAVAHFSADTREQLNRFIQQTSSQLDGMKQEILRIDGEQRAHRHLDRVFVKWAAGGYARFSCLQRLYAALEDLYWGDFGACVRHHKDDHIRNDLISHLESKAVIQIRNDRQITGSNEQRTSLDEWITLPASSQPLDQEALTWLGDWSSEDTPLSYTATHPGARLVVGVPRRLDSSRAVDMVREFFEVRE